MPAPRRSGLLLALLSLALVAPSWGCGGGGGDGGIDPASGPLSLSTFQPAALVLGQPGFGSSAPNQGGATGAGTLSYPTGISGGSLWVCDALNNRVLRFAAPLSSSVPDLVVGQPDFASSLPALSAIGLASPIGVCARGGMLAVSDFQNNRVLVWNPAPTTSGAQASVVVGQGDFISKGGGTSAFQVAQPEGVLIVDGKLVVCDPFNNRVLIWNAVPGNNGAPADIALGQPNTSTTGTGSGAGQMNEPRYAWSDGTRLVVTESDNNRALVWNTFPVASGQPADFVLGQPGFNMSGSGTSASAFTAPSGVDSDGTRLVISDLGNSRVLVWNTFPTSSGQPADVVLGQGDFVHGARNDDDQDGMQDAAPSARTFFGPTDVAIEGSVLYVTDQGNHRLLVFASP